MGVMKLPRVRLRTHCAILLLCLSAPISARAGDRIETSRHPLGSNGGDGWKVLMGAPSADTLRASRDKAFLAAEQALEQDGWIIELADPRSGRIETTWKPMHHFLLSLFAGKVEARCFVAVDSLAPGRSAVSFRGGLASRHSLEGNVMLPFARRAYGVAARDWHTEVREDVALMESPALGSTALRASEPPDAAPGFPTQ